MTSLAVTTPLLLFPDTTVLINFRICQAMPVLETLVSGRGRWTATIERECMRKERDLSLPDLASVAAGIFGDPLIPHREEHRAIRDLRILMASPGDHRDQHLGEAETITILEHRGLHAVFITDDSHVQEFTTTKCITSWDLLGYGLKAGSTTEAEIRAMRTTLLNAQRVHRPEIRSAQRFEQWLSANRRT